MLLSNGYSTAANVLRWAERLPAPNSTSNRKSLQLSQNGEPKDRNEKNGEPMVLALSRNMEKLLPGKMFPDGHQPPRKTVFYTYKRAGLVELKEQNGSLKDTGEKFFHYINEKDRKEEGPNDPVEDHCSFVPATVEVVKQLMKNNKHIASVVCADSLDKQRADNSTEHTRNHYFNKVNNYAFMIYKMGVSMYGPNYKDWPISSQGDGEMTRHTTIAITSRADGYYKDLNNDLKGACPPFVIHDDPSTSTFLEDERIRKKRDGPNEEVFVNHDFCNGLAPSSSEIFVGEDYNERKEIH
eukprot:15365873-Ditylum_brightwellii.AAC.1